MSAVASGYYFPDAVDGWKFQFDLRAPLLFHTEQIVTETGRRIRRARYPVGGIQQMSGTIQPQSLANGQILRDFFTARQGMYQNFYLFLPPKQMVSQALGTGNGTLKNFVIAFRDAAFSSLTVAGVVKTNPTDYSFAAITKAEILNNSAGVVTITVSVNDVLGVKIDGGSTISVTLTAGVGRTMAQIAADLNANGSFTAVAVADTTIDGLLRIQSKTTGRTGIVQIDGTVTHSAAVTLGLDTLIPHYTGNEVRITFVAAPANGAAIVGSFSSVRERILATFNTDALPQAYFAAAATLESYTLGFAEDV